MHDKDAFRRRLISAGVDLPDALIDLIATSIGAMIGGLDELANLDLDTLEPFAPASQLAHDAER